MYFHLISEDRKKEGKKEGREAFLGRLAGKLGVWYACMYNEKRRNDALFLAVREGMHIYAL